MPRLPRRFALVATLALGLAVGWLAGRSEVPVQAADSADALGREQLERFFVGVTKDHKMLEDLLGESFQLIRTDGRVYDRTQYLAGASVLSSYEVTELKATQLGDSLTVTFRVSIAGKVAGVEQKGDALPRMAVFQRHDGDWKMVAFANLGQGSGDVAAEADKALQGFFDATYSGDPAKVRAVLAPEFQLARSDGTGIVGMEYADKLPTFTQRAEISDVIATGYGDIMVVRYRVNIGLVIDGKQAEAVSPRLTVFRRDGGSWKVVSHSNFARLEQ